MNDDELATVVKASVTDVHMTIPAEQIISRSQAIRNRRRIPGLAAGMAVVAAAVLAVTALLPGHSATVRPGIHLSAWTVVKQADGTVYVSINQLRDPAGLQRKLRADGVPASVVFGNAPNVQPEPCQWYHGNAAGLLPKVVPSIAPGPGRAILAIDPSALPQGPGCRSSPPPTYPESASAWWPSARGAPAPEPPDRALDRYLERSSSPWLLAANGPAVARRMGLRRGWRTAAGRRVPRWWQGKDRAAPGPA